MKSYKPTTPSKRQASTVEYRKVLTAAEPGRRRGRPEKSLTYGRKRAVGRNSAGRITTRHKGGGHKRRYREIDFKYDKIGVPARIASVEYDPNRTGFIGLAVYQDGAKRYVLLPQGLRPGDRFLVSAEAELRPGNRLPLGKIPVGSFVYNLEIQPGGGARLVRSAGSFAQVLSTDAGQTLLKMPSSETRQLSAKCWASLGAVSNEEQKLQNIGKAGRSRWLGIRPTVRGSAQNPVDHPHGGGEGRQGIGLRRGPKTPWGKLAYGVKTRRPKKYSRHAIITRRVKKPRR